MAMTYTNMAGINDKLKDGKPATPLYGKLAAWKPVGTKMGDNTVRRSVIYYNVTASVPAKSKYPGGRLSVPAIYQFDAAPTAASAAIRLAAAIRFQLGQSRRPDRAGQRARIHDRADPRDDRPGCSVDELRRAGRARQCARREPAGGADRQGHRGTGDEGHRAGLEENHRRRRDETVAAIRAQRSAWPTIVD